MQFGTWLRVARASERDRGVDHHELACHPQKLTPYIRDHMARALQGMEELYAQLPAEVLPVEQQRQMWEDGRDAFIVRMREAVDHIGAVLTAVGCTEEALERADSEGPVEADTEVDEEKTDAEEPACDETVQLPVIPVKALTEKTKK